jgi:hypothetical protein
MPDIHDRYAGVGGCYVINKKGERVPEVEPVTEPEPVAPIEAQADADS